MRVQSWVRCSTLAALAVSVGALLLGGCEETKEALETDITGRVTDNRGEAVVGATVRLYSLLDNTDFVEGSDIKSAEAYINREAVLASNDTVAVAQTGADGGFEMGAIPNAFLAVAVKDGCSAGFAGFNEETGVLNVDTLITPNFKDGLNFKIPTFVVACATPPEVGPEGNSADAPAFEPPAPSVSCDAQSCVAAGGTCEGDTCAITCVAATCTAAGGTCVSGTCNMPACNPTTCTAAGGVCSGDGKTCNLPACRSDADCQSGQPGSFCEHPGDVALSACRAPLPGEIVPPDKATGWSSFRITDSSDKLLADASAGNQAISSASIPADGSVRIYGEYGGSVGAAYVQVQCGGQTCSDLPPRTDYIKVDVVDGKLSTDRGNFLELAVHGGYQKVLLSSSNVLGEGERSFAVEIGDRCTPPKHPFTAILSWEAGPGQPADLDLNVWNASGELLFVGKKQAAWGRLAKEGKGPGPEVFESDDASKGPFTIKVQFFSGKPRDIQGKVRIIRTVAGKFLDDSYVFAVKHPKDVAEIGTFASE